MKTILAILCFVALAQVAEAEEGGGGGGDHGGGNEPIVVHGGNGGDHSGGDGHTHAGDDHTHSGGSGGTAGPQPSTQQLLEKDSKQSFDKWSGASNKGTFSLLNVEIWNLANSIAWGSGFGQDEAIAQLKGAILAQHSGADETYAEANNRLAVTIERASDHQFPLSSSIIVPLPSVKITVKTAGSTITTSYLVVPSGPVDIDQINKEYPSLPVQQKVWDQLFAGKSLEQVRALLASEVSIITSLLLGK